MKKLIVLLSVFVAIAECVLGQPMEVRVQDEQTKEPIVQAHITLQNKEVLTVTNADGVFQLEERYQGQVVTLSAVGYAKKTVQITPETEIIFLTPVVFKDQKDVLVVAHSNRGDNIRAYHPQNTAHSMDEYLDQIDGMSTTKRGAYGWEPVIRGQSDQRMNLVIDGMQVFKACVDKMDPITSYVESSNLSQLEIDKSGASVAENGTGNSTVNLITQKAEARPFAMDITSAYRLPDQYRQLGLSGNMADNSRKHAFRYSATYKKADSYQAGNNQTIDNTQYEKLNANLSYRYSFSDDQFLEANYITDKAWDIGYPALLMDATKALADMGQLRLHLGKNNGTFSLQSVMLYANSIRHSMDDYNRDVANRPVMRNMYMPMYGTTTTFGSRLSGHLQLFGKQFEWFGDLYRSKAFGDMLMESLDPDIADMHIYNLDDVYTSSASLGLRQRFNLTKSVLLKMEQSIRFSELKTTSRSYASFFEGVYDRPLSPRRHVLLSGSGSLLWMLTDRLSFSGSLVYSERMGNHMELFGHYIYNYTDGYFYDGNPWLELERTLNTELGSSWETDRLSLSLTFFYKQYFNYIDGIIAKDLSSSADFRFKRYANVGDAVIAGTEFRTIATLNSTFRLENRLSYLYGHNQSLDEPLPLMPPLKGFSTLHIHTGQSRFMTDLEWAASQNRIAESTSNEDQTDAYAVLNIRWERTWLKNRLSSTIDLSNILNTHYHTHTSIGNIPEAGRTLMLSLQYHF